MFSKSSKKKSITNLTIDTVIANGITIKGDIVGKGSIRIDGKVEGNVELEKGVVIGEKAEITGQIKSNEVIVYGKHNGDLICKTLLIKETGNISGNMTVEAFSVDLGGKYTGNLKMSNNEIKLNTRTDEEAKEAQ